MKNIIAFILAGGRVDEMSVLTMSRCKSSVPFAGMYRIIDFPLTNLSLSGIDHVGILSQYRPSSLMDHVGIGHHWDYDTSKRDLKFLPPYQGSADSDWYKGTADAVYQNLHFIKRYNPKDVLIISGDHIYRMNYNAVLSFHRSKQSDLTIVFKPMKISGKCRFGIGEVDNDGRVVSYEEKPEKPQSNLASLTIYIFKTDILLQELAENEKSGKTYHIYNEIIPRMVKNNRVFGYIFRDYWEYSRTIDSYYQAHMDLLTLRPALNLKGLMTNLEDHDIGDAPEAIIGKNAIVKNSILSPGCYIEGTVLNSVLSPWVRVEDSAEIKNSIIMHKSVIKKGAILNKVIMDKYSEVSPYSKIGADESMESIVITSEIHGHEVTLIGKKVFIPENSVIGKNCIIWSNVRPVDKIELANGENLEKI